MFLKCEDQQNALEVCSELQAVCDEDFGQFKSVCCVDDEDFGQFKSVHCVDEQNFWFQKKVHHANKHILKEFKSID